MEAREKELRDFSKEIFGQDDFKLVFLKDIDGGKSNIDEDGKIIVLCDGIDDMGYLKSVLIHEMSHLLYTDFKFAYDDSSPQLITIFFVAEDIIMERDMIEAFPDTQKHLFKANSEYIYKYFKSLNVDYQSMNEDDVCLRLIFKEMSKTGHCFLDIDASIKPDALSIGFEKYERFKKEVVLGEMKTSSDAQRISHQIMAFFGDYKMPSYYFSKR